MREKLGVLRPAVPAQKKGQKAQDHEDPVQALGIGDGHVVEGRSQQIGQGDAQQQGGDAYRAGIDHPACALDGSPHGICQAEEHIEQGDALEEPAANGGGR